MSDFTWIPIFPAKRDNAPKLLKAQFGDGYEQRVADGINTIKDIWDLTFRGTRTEIAAIRNFLRLKNGVMSFTWTPDGESEITVKCESWSDMILTGNTATLNAKFEQVFE